MKNCTENDIEKIYTPCINNQRDILSTKIRNCKDQNLFFPILKNITCDTLCEKGYKYDYDFKSSKPTCQKCPVNTFSKGGNLIITGEEWKDIKLPSKSFNSKCMVYSVGKKSEDTDCTAFSSNLDGTILSSGGTNKSDAKYIGILTLGFKSKNKGEMKFRYKKDTSEDIFFKNGMFFLFYDYDLILKDDELNSEWKIYSKEILPGDHNLVWVYEYWSDSSNSNKEQMKLQLESLEITGIDDTSYDCQTCVDGISNEGSEKCYKCGLNTYFQNSECIKCSDDKFSFANSLESKSCYNKEACDIKDYYIFSKSECQNGTIIVRYNLTQPSLCDINNKNSLKLEEKKFNCRNNDFKTNQKNFNCSKDKFVSTLYRYGNISLNMNIFNYSCSLNQYCDHFQGWIFDYDKIYLNKYLPNSQLRLELSKKIKLKFKAFPSISFNLRIVNLKINDLFVINLNGRVYKRFSNLEKEYREKISIDLSESKKDDYSNLELFFYRDKINDSMYRPINSPIIEIEDILLRDIFEEGELSCEKCPLGMKSDSHGGCVKCPESETSNLNGKKLFIINLKNKNISSIGYFTSILISSLIVFKS
jgi:hypothetical protein